MAGITVTTEVTSDSPSGSFTDIRQYAHVVPILKPEQLVILQGLAVASAEEPGFFAKMWEKSGGYVSLVQQMGEMEGAVAKRQLLAKWKAETGPIFCALYGLSLEQAIGQRVVIEVDSSQEVQQMFPELSLEEIRTIFGIAHLVETSILRVIFSTLFQNGKEDSPLSAWILAQLEGQGVTLAE